jgi:Gas vesicle synthesis protein GvpL/GvpF
VSDEVLYLYAVTDSDIEDVEVIEMRAVDGAPVHVIAEASVAAVVSAVDADRFSESAVRHSMEDLHWLETIARAHNAVVSDLARRRPVAPVRLATMFANIENVRSLLRVHAEDFVAALDRIRGRCEWAVKGFAVDTEPLPATAGPAEALGPGRSYLQRRRAERDGRDRRSQEAVAEAEAVHDRLVQLTLASRRYPPQDRRLSGQRDEMVLNAAYLLPEGVETEIRRVVDEYHGGQLRLELTGPWAPYSFATLESAQ